MPKMMLMIGAVAAAALISSSTNAQPSEEFATKANAAKSIQSVTTSSAFKNSMHVSAMRHFLKNFGDDLNESWSASKEGTRARFEKNNALYLVDYDKKGKWHSTIRIYKETVLPKEVRNTVKSVYYDFDIVTVTELTVPRNKLYFVKLQDEKSLKTVRVVDGYMEEIEDFDRGDRQ